MVPELPSDVVSRICTHMNDDHADAVAGYARHFARCSDVASARIVALDAYGMDLDVAGTAGNVTVRIAFDHPLRDGEDARRTLVAMAQQTGPTRA